MSPAARAAIVVAVVVADGASGGDEARTTTSSSTADDRTHGWRNKLAASAIGEATFRAGFRPLEEVASDDVPRGLAHSDLVNRNLHMVDGEITGVFDRGEPSTVTIPTTWHG